MTNYKKKLVNQTDAENFLTNVKALIKSTSGTYSSVANKLNINSGILQKREIEAYKILNQNGGFEPLEFQEGVKKEKSIEENITPKIEEDGSLILTIPKHLVQYLSLGDKEEILKLKVKNQDSDKGYKPSIELTGYKAFADNQAQKKNASILSKERKKLQKNNGVSAQA